MTFYQWLDFFEFMSVEEFNELPQYKQEMYKNEFNEWCNKNL